MAGGVTSELAPGPNNTPPATSRAVDNVDQGLTGHWRAESSHLRSDGDGDGSSSASPQAYEEVDSRRRFGWHHQAPTHSPSPPPPSPPGQFNWELARETERPLVRSQWPPSRPPCGRPENCSCSPSTRPSDEPFPTSPSPAPASPSCDRPADATPWEATRPPSSAQPGSWVATSSTA